MVPISEVSVSAGPAASASKTMTSTSMTEINTTKRAQAAYARPGPREAHDPVSSRLGGDDDGGLEGVPGWRGPLLAVAVEKKGPRKISDMVADRTVSGNWEPSVIMAAVKVFSFSST